MKRKYSRAIKKIAKKEGVSPEFVYAEIKKAITIGYNNLDPVVQAYWRKICPDGRMPTPEEYIEIIANDIKSK